MNILHVENDDFSIKMIVDRLEAFETRTFDATLTVRVITSSLHLYCHGGPYDFTFSYLKSFCKQLDAPSKLFS
ncbi:hypothetical protein ABC345_04670 [Shouchella sp. 1P09AA]|uniref:hypothetical protein n=1 Tax=unclassified Shouchella TaxID=2893065 RepID=UPI0039A1A8ED